ncbi:hypothetical protein ANCCAN_21627 [Ancylostoma caninum]|uniref:Uncharacterized protein n=1 Tax=Ancylostoma caninum TaxID=29170 RepID=A0A368FKH8_ANCCA|nr:hypothetical protein ANCCAN_21627 [Ancylostoma caninum]
MLRRDNLSQSRTALSVHRPSAICLSIAGIRQKEPEFQMDLDFGREDFKDYENDNGAYDLIMATTHVIVNNS